VTQVATLPPASMSKLECIRALTDAGYVLIPLCTLTPHDHWSPEGPKPCKTPGKVPRQRDWRETAPGRYPVEDLARGNYGVVLKAGDLIIDVDPRNFKEGDRPLIRLAEKVGAINSFSVRTGGGGLHIYLRKSPDAKIRSLLKEYPGVEFKSAGQQVVGPGSMHISGKEYAVASGNPNNVAESPTALLALIERALVFDDVGTKDYVNDAATQGRYRDYLQHQAPTSGSYVVACHGRDLGLPPASTLELMIEVWNPRRASLRSPEELRVRVEHAYKYAKGAVGAKHPAAVFDAVQEEKKPEAPPSAKDLPWNTSPQGKLLKTFNNLLNLMKASEYGLAGIFGYNEFIGRYEFTRPAPWHRGRMPRLRSIGDDDLKLMRGFLSTRCGYDTTVKDIEEAITNVAHGARFHPVRDYLDALKWDGKRRLDTWLHDFLGVKDDIYTRACAAKTLTAAVWRIYEPGVKFDHVLILEGRQDLGKSTAVEILARPWHCDSPIDPHARDTVDLLQGRWIVEMAEMEVTRRVEEEALKAFITRKVDMARLAFGRMTREFPRQSIFIATKNPRNDGTYLKDEENRRWWPVRCEPEHGPLKQIDFDGLTEARDQLFAEAVVRMRGMKHPKELSMHTAELKSAARGEAALRHAQHEWLDAVAGWIARLDSTAETRREFLTTREIFVDGLGGIDRALDRRSALNIATVMRSLSWRPALKWNAAEHRPVRGYERAPVFDVDALVAEL